MFSLQTISFLSVYHETGDCMLRLVAIDFFLFD